MATTATAETTQVRLPQEALGRVFAFGWTLEDAMEQDLADVGRVLVASKESTPTTELMESAAKKGKLAFVRMLHALGSVRCSTKAMDGAASAGHVDVVRFLHIHRTEGCTPDAMTNALKNNYIDVVKFLAKYRKEKWTDAALKWAVEHSELEVVRDLLRNSPSSPAADAKVLAYKAKNMELLTLLYDLSEDRRPTFNLVTACEEDDMAMVQFLCSREGFVKVAMVEAIVKGSLPVVQYLHEHANITHTDASRVVPMNEAAANGHLHVLEYLHKNAPELACSIKAMDLAASKGHLAVVEFLHTHRSEGCSERALDSAAMNGHLNVVQFLHENRKDVTCTTKAMDYAAARNHLDVLAYLHAHRHEGCTVKAFNDAALYGHARIVAFLLTHYPALCDAEKGIGLAKQRNYTDVITLLETFHSSGVVELPVAAETLAAADASA